MPKKKKNKPLARNPQPTIIPGDAFRMVKFLAGDANSIECFHGLRKDGPWGRKSSRCIHGAITNREITSKLEDWNLNGFDLYMTVHLVRDGIKGNPKNGDIEEGRSLFIDSDGEPRPNQWHLPPDFIIEREDDPKRNWWAFWIINGKFPADQVEHYQKRIAEQYGTDPSVSDARRIIRLPGFIRYKHNEGTNKKNAAEGDTIYRLFEGVGR
jgi:hypothetical protein